MNFANPTPTLYGALTEYCPSSLHYTEGCKGKGKAHPIISYEGPEVEYKYSCILSLTSALDGVGGQCHGPTAYTQEDLVPIV